MIQSITNKLYSICNEIILALGWFWLILLCLFLFSILFLYIAYRNAPLINHCEYTECDCDKCELDKRCGCKY
jgi:hypothetical protein